MAGYDCHWSLHWIRGGEADWWDTVESQEDHVRVIDIWKRLHIRVMSDRHILCLFVTEQNKYHYSQLAICALGSSFYSSC